MLMQAPTLSPWPAGDGEMARRIRAHDWAATPLGPVEGWSERLRTSVDVILPSGLPMVVLWGEALIQIYNDAYRVLMGARHPHGFGLPTHACWPEARSVTAPLYERVRAGETMSLEDKLIPLSRRGVVEDAWFTLSLSPLRDEEGVVAGVLASVVETTSRQRAVEAVRESEARFRGFAEASADVLWIADARGEHLDYLSPAFERIFGVPRETVLAGAAAVAPLIHPEDRATFLSIRPRTLAGETVIVHYRVLPPDGSVLHVRDTSFQVHDKDGRVVQIAGIVQDISDIEVARSALQAEKERFRTLAEGIPSLIWRADATGGWTWSSPQWCACTGQSQEESRGLGWLAAIHPEDREAAVRAWEVAPRQGALDVEFRVRCIPDGRYLWHRTRSTPVRDARGRIVEWLGTTTDIQDLKELQGRQQHLLAELQDQARDLEGEIRERRQIERRLLYAAQHDDLTGLRNRTFLMERLRQALARSGERGGGRCAVLFLDLDRFKLVNDSLGHQAGDQLLMEVGRRLRACTRGQDTAARFGGDEFALLLEEVNDLGTAVAVAERIVGAMRRPVRLGHQEVFSTCSVGVVYVDGGYATPEEVLRDADTAMYHAKRGGHGGHAVFSEAMRAGAVEALDLRTDLRNAVSRSEFCLHYQPIYDTDAGAVVGAEALIRWRHPQRGLVSPAAFVPVAEECGLIREIGRWVLREACGQLRAWCDRFPGLDLYLNVNASGAELHDPTYAADVRDALHAAGLDPRQMQIEITESIFLHQPDVVGGMLDSIRALGVRVALDDFGTGYSSLSYLDRYRIDTIKIDRSFVVEMPSRPNAAAIVRAIVDLGHAMKLSVVAEGVEDGAQLKALREAGCGLVQGYLLGRPASAEDITALLAAQPRRMTG